MQRKIWIERSFDGIMSIMSYSDPFQKAPKFLSELPLLVRLYIFHCMIGFAISGIFTFCVIHYDVAGIGRMAMAVEGGWIGMLAFFILNGTLFAGVQFAVMIMSMDYDGQGPRRGKPVREEWLKPYMGAVPVEVKANRRGAHSKSL